MQLLVCAATEMEIEAIKAATPYKALPPGHAIRFLITGIGIGAATYSLTKNIIANKPDLILQAGVAGTFDPLLLPGDTVVVQSDTIADTGAQEGAHFHHLFDMKLADKNCFPWKEGLLANPYAQRLSQPGLQLVQGITVNEITTNTERAKHYQVHWGAQTESMEGAALHYVCLQEDVPFLQLRSISNYIGERDKKRWKLKEAIQNLNMELSALIDKIMEL